MSHYRITSLPRKRVSLGFTLHTPKHELKGFSFAKDREYYSEPRKVELIYSDVATRLVWVSEPIYGTFPASPSNLVEQFEYR